jgi:GNAT superfamily N-acetyltransferase
MSYEIVSYSPAFDAQIAELQQHLWSPDPVRNAAYLKWKHLENPFLTEPVVQLALHAGRAVAMRSAFGAIWEAGDGQLTHLLPYVDDFVVAPEHRNSGIARRIMQSAIDEIRRRGFRYAVNLSAGSTTFVNSLATGWRGIGSFKVVSHSTQGHSRLQQVAAIIRRTPLHRFAGTLRAVLMRVVPPSRALDKIDRSGTTPGPISVTATARPQEMAALIRRLPWDGRVRHVRDERYFAWRFRNPFSQYRFLYWDDGDGLQGYLVLQQSRFPRADFSLLNIADWEGVNEAVRTALLDTALGVRASSQLRAWTATESAPTRSLLQARSFAPVVRPGLRGRTEGVLVRRLETGSDEQPWLLNGRDLRGIDNWDLRMLYSMSA